MFHFFALKQSALVALALKRSPSTTVLVKVAELYLLMGQNLESACEPASLERNHSGYPQIH